MSLFSSIVNAFSSQKAADAQKRAADAAIGVQKQNYQTTRSDYAPYRETGSNALSQLANASGVNGQQGYDTAFSNFRADPGYQYAVDQGLNSATASQAAGGIFNSGGTLKALQTRGQGMADQGYGNYLSRLRDLMSGGLSATAGTAAAGQNYANQSGQYYTDRGNANANSIMAPALGLRQFEQDAGKYAGAFMGGAFGR